MIRSMTGYGRARKIIGDRDITVELKSVNHRYCETFIRIPRSYMQIEDILRGYLQKNIHRGKIEVSVNIDRTENAPVPALKTDDALLAEYVKALREAAEKYGLTDDLTATSVLRFPDVLQRDKEDPDIDEVWAAVKETVDEALSAFFAQREREGVFLVENIVEKCGEIEEHVKYIESRSEKLMGEYKAKLEAKISELLGGATPDEQRVLTEVAIMADKTAIDEELVRLASHTKNLKNILSGAMEKKEAESVGKKVDFVIQEMNREINTISSKIGDMDVTLHVIEVKNCIEKIREQIQNIE